MNIHLHAYCKAHDICPIFISPSHGNVLFCSIVLIFPVLVLDYTFYKRMCIRPSFEFAHCQKGEIKKRLNKNQSTVYCFI